MISHAIWADNVWLVSHSLEQVVNMFCDVTSALKGCGLHWKLESLECLTGSSIAKPAHIDATAGGEQYCIKSVDSMNVLGVLLTREGSTQASFEARLAAGSKAFYANRASLCSRLMST
eukprot:10735874-Karenia_brevis.AAC.1